ncbi:MAG: hypothetical protein R3281_09705 [Balneolaceae bacterium]|nr:hypothetical protein [Balneolaceae bacterium]
MTHSYKPYLLAMAAIIAVSCSASQQATKSTTDRPSTESTSIYPAWFSAEREFVQNDSVFTAYGVAIGADSAEAAAFAIEKAKANFQQHFSSRLESVREQAVVEQGSNAGQIDSGRFIFALRNAEAVLPGYLRLNRTSAEVNGEFSSYRAFASVIITKQRLLDRLEDELKSAGQAWQVLRSSNAFQKL